MKTITLSLCSTLLLWLSGCTAQIKPIGEAPLNLSTFKFNTTITTLYPDKNKSKTYEGFYEMPVNDDIRFIEKDTTFLDEFSADKKAVGIEYRQKNSSSIDKLASFQNQAFNKINFATSLYNRINVVCAVAEDMPESENVKFVNVLSKKFGKYKKMEGEFGRKFFIYEWQADDRIYRFSSVYNDESSTMKLEIDGTNKTIKPGVKEPHLEGYFYIIRKDYIKRITELNTGDFAFID